jgi:hypothetical protein
VLAHDPKLDWQPSPPSGVAAGERHRTGVPAAPAASHQARIEPDVLDEVIQGPEPTTCGGTR